LMALIVLVMFVGDNPRLFKKYRHQTIQLDTAFTDETKLRFELERMLGARVHKVTVQHLDLVNDTTLVDVRYQVGDLVATKVESEHEALVGAAR